jgi:PTS system ascorbate-specific IIA component
MDADTTSIVNDIEKSLTQLNTDEGILFITDIFGGTPSNVAKRMADRHHAHLISGINLPMVIRLLNYRDEPVKSLILKALEGAKTGIEDNAPKPD